MRALYRCVERENSIQRKGTTTKKGMCLG